MPITACHHATVSHFPAVMVVCTHRVEAGVEVHGGAGWEEGEPLPPLKLHEEVVRAVVVSVCHDPGSPDPQVDLECQPGQIKKTEHNLIIIINLILLSSLNCLSVHISHVNI